MEVDIVEAHTASRSRIMRGLMPISREFDSDRVSTRETITMVLQVHALIESLREQRESDTMGGLIEQATDSEPRYTFASLSSGGCCDAIGSLKSGLRPLYGTEICERKRQLWRRLTGTTYLGDTGTYTTEWKGKQSPNILWSGQTCTDYSRSGPKTGSNGKTGWMFVEQCKVIKELKPHIAILEMVSHALEVNDGVEVK